MTTRVLTEITASVTELKRAPERVAGAGGGQPVAILNRNAPSFYVVPAALFEKMYDALEDMHLNALADERENEESMEVTLDELRAQIQKKRL